MSAIFERFFSCFIVVPISRTRKFRKNTHTLPCFSLKNHGQSFFLNHLFLQFNSRINRGFCFCKWSPCEDICGILLCKNEFYKNIYLPKYIFHKKFIPLRCYKDLNKLHCDIGKRVQCILFIKCISTFWLKQIRKKYSSFVRVQFNVLMSLQKF